MIIFFKIFNAEQFQFRFYSDKYKLLFFFRQQKKPKLSLNLIWTHAAKQEVKCVKQLFKSETKSELYKFINNNQKFKVVKLCYEPISDLQFRRYEFILGQPVIIHTTKSSRFHQEVFI